MKRVRPDRVAISASYDQAADSYESRFREKGLGGRSRVMDRVQLAAVRDAHAVLELGCGTGRLLSQVDAPVVVGIDLSRGMLGKAREKGLRGVVLADAQHLPLKNASVGGIVAGCTVFRYLDPDQGMQEIARVLEPGGCAALHHMAAQTWSLRPWAKQRRPNPLHLDRADELDDAAERAGLQVERRYLWRAVRFPPYLLPVPGWLPGRWWRHCVLVLRRR